MAVDVVEYGGYADVLRVLGELLARGDGVAIAPQVFAEFLPVATDARRFQTPFSIENGLGESERRQNAAETEHLLPTELSIARFDDWMRNHNPGRKRWLDTLLAATCREAGITSLLTLKTDDFIVIA